MRSISREKLAEHADWRLLVRAARRLRRPTRYRTLVLDTQGGVTWRNLPEPHGRPWRLGRKAVWVALKRNGTYEPFIPPYRAESVTPSDLMCLLDNNDVRELMRPTYSPWLQKVEVGLLLALTLGLALLFYVVFSSLRGG